MNGTDLIGKFKYFGAFGPAYEIIGLGSRNMLSGDMLKIRVLESGEQLEYPVNEAVKDPEA